jgi:serine O-acetyltransferase
MAPPLDASLKLEDAIDRITRSYALGYAINNLDSSALPNRRAVVEAYEHIASAIYLGFYATWPLGPHNLRHSLSEHLYPAHAILSEQIRRAVSYETGCTGTRRSDVFAEEVTLALLAELPHLRELLNEDAESAFECDPAARSLEEVVFSYPTLKAITAHRVAHVLHRHEVPMIPRILAEHAHSFTGIDIHPGAQIGRRFFIDHGTGVVIGETCEIGNDVKIYQGVTLGALSGQRSAASRSERHKRHPTIGDRVTIYAGATILGGETVVGEDSVIGGNVWLVRSVPPRTKLFGRSRDDQGPDSAPGQAV